MTYIEQLQNDKDDLEYGYATIVSVDVPDEIPEPRGIPPEDADHAVAVTIETKTDRTFTHYMRPPQAWHECELTLLLDHFDVEPENYEGLVGKKVPIVRKDRPFRKTGKKFIIDTGFFKDPDDEKDVILGE